MQLIDLAMTTAEISNLSNAELAEGLSMIAGVVANSYQDIVKKEKQLAAIRRVRSAIARNSETDKNSTMHTFNDALLEDYRTLMAELKHNQTRHERFVTMRKRWRDEETQRLYQSYQAQLEADLIDKDCVPVEQKHSCHHCCCCCH